MDQLSPQAACLEESLLLEHTRWVSYSQPTGESQTIPGVPEKFGCQWSGKPVCEEVALEPDGVPAALLTSGIRLNLVA